MNLDELIESMGLTSTSSHSEAYIMGYENGCREIGHAIIDELGPDAYSKVILRIKLNQVKKEEARVIRSQEMKAQHERIANKMANKYEY